MDFPCSLSFCISPSWVKKDEQNIEQEEKSPPSLMSRIIPFLSPSPPIYRQTSMVSGVTRTICHFHYFVRSSDMWSIILGRGGESSWPKAKILQILSKAQRALFMECLNQEFWFEDFETLTTSIYYDKILFSQKEITGNSIRDSCNA